MLSALHRRHLDILAEKMCITCDGFHQMAIPGETGFFQFPRPFSAFIADGRLSLSGQCQSHSTAEVQPSSGLFGIHCRFQQFDIATHGHAQITHPYIYARTWHLLVVNVPGKMQFCLNNSVNWGAMHRCDLQNEEGSCLVCMGRRVHLFSFLDGDEDRCFGKAQHSKKSRERDAATKETRLRRRFGCAGSEVDLQCLDVFSCRMERLKDDDVACSPEGDANEGDRYCGLSHGASLRLRVPKQHLWSCVSQRRAVLSKVLAARPVVGA